MNTQLNTDSFIVQLQRLDRSVTWRIDPLPTQKDKRIYMYRRDRNTLFTPVTAVYFHLTRVEIHHGSFWCEEMTRDFGFPPMDIVEIVYAQMGLVCGRSFDPHLRNRILTVLGLPQEKIGF